MSNYECHILLCLNFKPVNKCLVANEVMSAGLDSSFNLISNLSGENSTGSILGFVTS